MTHSVKKIFYTLQGKGANAGRPVVFCRFGRCNLWSGLEIDGDSAVCRFCNIDSVGLDESDGEVKFLPPMSSQMQLSAQPRDSAARRRDHRSLLHQLQ